MERFTAGGWNSFVWSSKAKSDFEQQKSCTLNLEGSNDRVSVDFRPILVINVSSVKKAHSVLPSQRQTRCPHIQILKTHPALQLFHHNHEKILPHSSLINHRSSFILHHPSSGEIESNN
jgi:hypothetical protein